MTDVSEEKIARDKAAVDAMRNAKSNMDAALTRISTLEAALGRARDDLTRTKSFIGTHVYTYGASGNQRTVHDYIDDMVSSATKALG